MVDVPKKIDSFLDVLAEQQARVDELSERNQERYARRFEDLLRNPLERDRELWGMFDDDPPVDVSLEQFSEIPVPQRDPSWRSDMAFLLTASHLQAWAELALNDLIDFAEIDGEEQIVEADALTQQDKRLAARAGISKTRVQNARQRRQDRA